MCHENTKMDHKKVESDPERLFRAPSGHHEVPDRASQRLAQSKSLNGRDFVRSKGRSKRTETPIWRLQGTPGTPPGAPKCGQKAKKSIFTMCHQIPKMDPKKVESDPETAFLCPERPP